MYEDINETIAAVSFSRKYLWDNISLFAGEGNVYLVTENSYKTAALKQNFSTFLKRRLDFTDLTKLQLAYKLYYFNLRELFSKTETDIAQKASAKKIISQGPDQITETLIDNFIELMWLLQSCLTEIYSYLEDKYSLRKVPSITVQEAIKEKLANTEWSELETSEVVIPSKGLKVNGRPDLSKFLVAETNDNYLKTIVSAETVTQHLIDLVESKLDFPLNIITRDLLELSIYDVYYNLSRFAYEQKYRVGIQLSEIAVNYTSKFGNIKDSLLKSISNSYDLIAEVVNDDRSEIFSELQQVKECIVSQPEIDIYNWKYPWLYRFKLRSASVFEQSVFNAFFGLDVFTLDDVLDTTTPLTSMAMVISSEVYDDCAAKICGPEVNDKFREEVLFNLGLTPFERIQQNILKIVPTPVEFQQQVDSTKLAYLITDN